MHKRDWIPIGFETFAFVKSQLPFVHIPVTDVYARTPAYSDFIRRKQGWHKV